MHFMRVCLHAFLHQIISRQVVDPSKINSATGRAEELRPLILGIYSPVQLALAIELGHNKPFLLDTIHGTNRYNFLLTTGMVFDDHISGKCLGLAWLHSGKESCLLEAEG